MAFYNGYVPNQPASYTPGSYQPMMATPQPSYAQQPAFVKAMEWVEGEVGAKAFQMPQGWPPNQPIPLWDSTDQIIYLKSWTNMGIPNPLQKIHYTTEVQSSQMSMLPAGTVSNAEPQHDMSNYVTKNDFDQLRQEIRSMMQQGNQPAQNQNQNGSSSQNMNRGGRNG